MMYQWCIHDEIETRTDDLWLVGKPLGVGVGLEFDISAWYCGVVFDTIWEGYWEFKQAT